MMASTETRLDPGIFRAYDIRGIVGENLNAEQVYLIGQALASVVQEADPLAPAKIIIARDGRFSSPSLAAALSAGINAGGADVIDLGMVPTPLLYFATHVLESNSGVMLTGSHNPSEYNGLKMVVRGVTLAEDEIKHLYQRIIQQELTVGSGTVTQVDIKPLYLEAVKKNIFLKRPLRIVIDAGNGVAGAIAPQLFAELGCEVLPLFCEVDGAFPHHHPDPSQPENLQALIAKVQEENADLGLAFDGDGDRLGIVTNKGTIIWSDRLLMLFARDVLAHDPQAKIIFDVKCTHHLSTFIKAHGGEPLMWKTGHSLIKAKMKMMNAQLAGEMSGHFFFSDRWYGFDDGLYAGARLLEILAAETVDSETLFAALPNSVNTPELKLLVKEEEKHSLMQALMEQVNFSDAELTTIDGLRVNFAEGWGLIRPSNTTPYLILRFEAINEGVLAHIQNLFRDWMLSVRQDLVLPF